MPSVALIFCHLNLPITTIAPEPSGSTERASYQAVPNVFSEQYPLGD